LTYSTLVMESLIALLLASPFRTPVGRMIAWALSASLHLSIDAVVQLGPFSWAMVTMFWVLIPKEAWDRLGPRVARRYPLRELCFDATSGFWISFCRIVKRFDVLEHVRFVPVKAAPESSLAEQDTDDGDGDEDDTEAEADTGAEPASSVPTPEAPAPAPDAPPKPTELERAVAETLVVVDPRTAVLHRGLGALVRLGDAVPFGALLLLPVRVPGISEMVERRLERAARRRSAADMYFEVEGLAGAPERFAGPPSGAALAAQRAKLVVRESLVLLVIVSCGSQVLIENRAVPKWLKPEHRPDWMTAIVVYPRMFQGWSMFAPSPPRDDGRIVAKGPR
jgi:hypothetical protein